MATSPNYAWAEPDNSSLVKNGAADIRTLGDAIDTSVWNVGFGQAGKNKFINGDFAINQRAFTSTTTDAALGFDRWALTLSGGSATYSAQTFTLGTAPVAGYEAKNYARLAVTTGNDYCRVQQKIESVRTFAGQTVTISFWAKGTNPATLGSLNVTAIQSFGSGGSPSSSVIQNIGSFTLTANWTRYSLTATIASIAGKTLGTSGNDSLDIGFGQGSNASTDSWTLDLWGVQIEYGSKATPFQTASGSIAGELALAQRYYAPAQFGIGQSAGSTTVITMNYNLPVEMRTAPSATLVSGTSAVTLLGTGNQNVSSISINASATRSMVLLLTGSGYTSNGIYTASQSGKIEFSAEI